MIDYVDESEEIDDDHREDIGNLGQRHQSEVAYWLKDNASLLKSSTNSEGTRYEIDGRFWEITDSNPEKGGAILKSKWMQYTFFVEFIPHDYGQVGKIQFWVESNSVFSS